MPNTGHLWLPFPDDTLVHHPLGDDEARTFPSGARLATNFTHVISAGIGVTVRSP